MAFTDTDILNIECNCKGNINFFDDGFDETDPDIKRRNTKAATEYFYIDDYDARLKYAKIRSESGKTYLTTLEGCTCPDYQKNFEPCKHILFFARCLGILDPQTGFLNSEENKKMFDFVDKYILNAKFDIRKIKTGFIKKNVKYETLIKEGVLEVSTDFSEIINSLTKEDLFDFMPDITEELGKLGIKIAKGASKKQVSQLLIENKEAFEPYFSNYYLLYFSEKTEEMLYDEHKVNLYVYVKKLNISTNKFTLPSSFIPNQVNIRQYEKPPTVSSEAKTYTTCKSCKAVIDSTVVECPSCGNSIHYTSLLKENPTDKLGCLPVVIVIIISIFWTVLT